MPKETFQSWLNLWGKYSVNQEREYFDDRSPAENKNELRTRFPWPKPASPPTLVVSCLLFCEPITTPPKRTNMTLLPLNEVGLENEVNKLRHLTKLVGKFISTFIHKDLAKMKREIPIFSATYVFLWSDEIVLTTWLSFTNMSDKSCQLCKL
jgi:hypothetical protein